MLRNYQEKVVVSMLDNPYMGLFIDMGLGKTLIVLEALDRLRLIEDLGPVLILAPPMVIDHVWQEESRKWGYDYTFIKLKGLPKAREKKIKQKADIYLLPSTLLTWLFDSKLHLKFKTVIVDEYSEFRSPNSNKFKVLKKMRPQIKRLYGLTGTPIPNGIYNIWGLILNLDMGERLHKTQKLYQQEYFYPGQMRGYVVYNWVARKGTTDKIFNKISDICISLKTKDHLDLPDFNTISIKCSMNKFDMVQYEQFKKDLVIEYKKGDLVAVNAAVLVAKLQQFTNGHVYLDNKEVQHIHDVKIDMLKELIEATDDNILVFYNYQFDLCQILKKIPGAKPLDVDKWNKGKQRVAVLHPKSGGHGLNLQDGGHTMIWFGPTWDLELYQQACKRIHRSGQKNKVLNYIITMEKSIDTHIVKALKGKEITQNHLFDFLDEHL